jgi:ATP-dependent helicase/nuclease subunit A
MSSSRKWTDEQWDAIRATGSGLLVSAAAGSGKTSVLAARCAHLVCDAADKCSVNELLVVTFTEAAAAEMKDRIEKALREKLAEKAGKEDLYVRKQLKLVEHAAISTLHGFCLRLVRQHFHRLGLDPGARVLDPDETALMRSDVVRDVFVDRYEASDEAFVRFVDAYGEGNDEGLMSLVLRAHDLMESLVDPQDWRRIALERIGDAGDKPLRESELGKDFLAAVTQELVGLTRLARQAAAARVPAEFPKYVQYVEAMSTEAEGWLTLLRDKGYDALARAVQAYEPERLPTYSNSLRGKQEAQAVVGELKDAMKDGVLREWLRFTSDEWQQAMRATRAHAAAFLSLVEEFGQRYEKDKREARGLDFADLERLALRLLRDERAAGLTPTNVARACHRQFRHVLVDEYQDINAVQEAILVLASTECLCGKDEQDASASSDSSFSLHPSAFSSNLFCVGDVKQSIYRFRLADPARFLAKAASFRDPGVHNIGRVIDLKANFRSRGKLLGAINDVFERLMSEAAAEITYDDSHRLREGMQYPDGDPKTCFAGSPIEMHVLPARPRGGSDDFDAAAEELDRTEREALLISRRVKQMMGQVGGSPRMCVMRRGDGGLQPDPIKYSDIVILLRATAHKADQIGDVLRAQGVPVYCDRGGGFFEAPEIRDMLALLSLLDNQRQDVPMAAVLRSPLSGLAHAEDVLARVRLAFADDPFHLAVVRYAKERDDELAASLNDFLKQLDAWRRTAHRRPLAEVIWAVYEQTGYLAYCAGLEDGRQRQANLLHFHQRAEQFGAFSRQGLYRFLRFLEQLQREQETARPAVGGEADDVVRIMSIHASKGLEFPVVFLPDLGKMHNLGDAKGSILIDRAAFLGLSAIDEHKQIRYPSLAQVMVKRRMLRQSLAEELRLLYVAMTRAKEHLVLIGTSDAANVEKWKEQWAAHAGALPPDRFSAGRSLMDWVGPAWAMLAGEGKHSIDVTSHDEAEMATWAVADALRPKLSKEQQRLARLEPLPGEPAVDGAARAVIDRLSYRYPHARLSQLPAVRSVSTWTKEGKSVAVAAEVEDVDERRRKQVPMDRVLRTPRILIDDANHRATQAEIGSATHLVLQYLDFAGDCDEADVAVQINGLVNRRLLPAAQARWVDVESILWFFGTEVGQMMRRHARDLWREMPFHLAVDPSRFDAAASSGDRPDQVMVRGRIDVMVPTPGGMVVIDYKTDRVTPADVAGRTEIYRGQVEIYREALQRITGKAIAACYLVYLTPRVVERVE